MKKLLLAIVAVLCFCGAAFGQYVKVLGVAGRSTKVVTSGVSSTNNSFVTYPLATIDVYAAGTTNHLTIYSNATGTVKANPFSATSPDAYYDFFVAPGTVFDLRVSGVSGGVTISAFTRSGMTAPGIAGAASVLCTGTADSALITAVLAAVPSTGGTIQIPSGTTCGINTKITVSKSNVTWLGQGATLRFDGANTTRLMDVVADNNTFQGITFSANNTQPLGSLVYVDDNVDNPKFIDCTFRDMLVTDHGVGGSILMNQVYAISVSPYAVTNFLFRNCLFYNLRNDNTAGVQGAGFVGGITFAKTNINVTPNTANLGTAAQPVPSNGVIDGCTFDTIKTILATGLTADDVSLVDDGDAIRGGYGGDVYSGTGVTTINLLASNNTFTNCSKRAIKFSQIQGLNAVNNLVIADKGAYAMTEVVKMYGNSTINGLNIQSPGIGATLTRSGATVTATTQTAHGLTTGEVISVFGATEQEYNNLVTVTVSSPTIFTYAITGTPTSPATGTIRVAKTPRVGISMLTLQDVTISHVIMNAGGSFVSFLDPTNPAPPQRNVTITNFACDNLDYGGIITATNFSATAYAITFANGYLGCIGPTARAIETPATLGSVGAMRFYNIEVRNGDVKIQGKNNIVDGLHITIDRSDFAGSSTSRALFEVGINSTTSYNIFRNVDIVVESILSTYLQAPRTALVTIGGSNTTTQNFSLRVPDAGALSTALPHLDVYGNDSTFDGYSYFGPGFVQIGVSVASSGSDYRNFSRTGDGLAASTPFIVTPGNHIVVQNVVDHRTLSGVSVDMSAGVNLLDGLASLSSATTVAANDQFGTVLNTARFSDIVRQEFTATITGNGVTVGPVAFPSIGTTLPRTLFLNATAGRTGTLFVAPTNGRSDPLTVIATTGMVGTVGVVAGATVVFAGAAPTFGVGSGNVRSMTFAPSSGLWYETGRAVVP